MVSTEAISAFQATAQINATAMAVLIRSLTAVIACVILGYCVFGFMRQLHDKVASDVMWLVIRVLVLLGLILACLL